MQPKRFPSFAVGLALLATVVVFFPVLFFGRTVSPLATLLGDPPWSSDRQLAEAPDSELRQAATAQASWLVEARRDGLATALFSPYLGCGGAGRLAWDNGLLSPLVLPLLPWLDATRLESALVLGKLLLAFVGCYLLLRRLGHQELPAATGAAAFALSGALSSWWLWPASATLAALPLLLWAVERALDVARPLATTPVATVAWLLFLGGGSLPATVVGGLVTIAWLVSRLAGWAPAGSPARSRGIVAVLLGLVLAAGLLSPSLALWVSERQSREPEPAAEATGLGLSVLRLLVDPFTFGDPRQETFEPPAGEPGLRFSDVAFAVGPVVLALALLGALARRRRVLWFAVLAAVCLAVLASTTLRRAAGALPGFGAADAGLLAGPAVLGLAVLAAAGTAAIADLVSPRLRPLTGLLAVAVVLGQGMQAGRLLDYPRSRDARLPLTPGLEWLAARSTAEPMRVAPLGDLLPPDTAAALGLEDVRGQLPARRGYRQWLHVVDPQVGAGTALRLNAATMDLGHPYLAALGPRYLLEPPELRLVEFALGQETLDLEPRKALLGPLAPGDMVVQELELPAGCSRLAVHATSQGKAVSGELIVRLLAAGGHGIGSWTLDAGALGDEGQSWLDLPSELGTSPQRLVLVPRLSEGELWLWLTPARPPMGRLQWRGEEVAQRLALSFDTSGYAQAYVGPDLRIWENRHAQPRFWLVHAVLPGTLATLLEANPPIALDRLAVVSPQDATELAPLLRPRGEERLEMTRRSPSSYTLRLELDAPALLVSSLPAAPPLWRARLDGAPAHLVTANGLFLGLPVPAGSHLLELGVALGGVWYGLSLGSGVALVALTGWSWRRRRARREESP